MTVILVLVTFLTFIVLDYLLNRKKALSMATAPERATAPALVGGDYVSGFHTPGQVSYHPGHTWLVQERKSVVRMGADEFAAALAQARPVGSSGPEDPLLLSERREDGNGFAHRG